MMIVSKIKVSIYSCYNVFYKTLLHILQNQTYINKKYSKILEVFENLYKKLKFSQTLNTKLSILLPSFTRLGFLQEPSGRCEAGINFPEIKANLIRIFHSQ